jgi:hypothetical protein
MRPGAPSFASCEGWDVNRSHRPSGRPIFSLLRCGQRATAPAILAFPDLGTEAIHEFDVVNMPVTVAVDSQGTSVHQTGPAEWAARIAQSLPGTVVLQ